MLIVGSPKSPNPLQINQYNLPIIYLNYSQTMSARALRHHKYLLPLTIPFGRPLLPSL